MNEIDIDGALVGGKFKSGRISRNCQLLGRKIGMKKPFAYYFGWFWDKRK